MARIIYYQEKKSGDYLAIDTFTNGYYLKFYKNDYFEGRSTAIDRMIESVQTTPISREFLQKECKKVPKAKVPKEWIKAIGY